MKKLLSVLALLACCAAPVLSLASEVRSGTDDQTGLAVTIYNNDLAMIRDQRRVTLPVAITDLAFEDISGKIKPETAQLSSQSADHSISLIEQNFEFDLLSPQVLLKASIGKQIGVISTHPTTGERSQREAMVLSIEGGVVLQYADHIETIRGDANDFVFTEVPNNFRARPTLLMTLENEHEGPQNIELNYLSHGLAWEANYVAQLNTDETALNLNAWVTLTNQSGTSYKNAQLQLVAGDVNTVQRPTMRMERSLEFAVAAKADHFSETEVFDYHLYRLNRATSLNKNQTKLN